MKELAELHPPNPNVVKHLEDMVEFAREGKLQSVIVIAQWDDGAVNHGWNFSDHAQKTRMVGELMCVVTALSFPGTQHYEKLYGEEG